MAHTPGPWVVAASGDCYSREYATLGVFEACDHPMQVATVITDLGEAEVAANAALISAAPDLLASLEAIIDAADARYEEYGDDSHPHIVAARAAIAKAKGERA